MLGTSHLVLFLTLSIQIRVPLFNDFVHKFFIFNSGWEGLSRSVLTAFRF